MTGEVEVVARALLRADYQSGCSYELTNTEAEAFAKAAIEAICSERHLVPASALEALRADKERLEKAVDRLDQERDGFAQLSASFKARAERAEASLAGRDTEIAKAVAEERKRVVGHPAPSLPTREEIARVLLDDLQRQSKRGDPCVYTSADLSEVGIDGEVDLFELADAILALFAQPQEKKP